MEKISFKNSKGKKLVGVLHIPKEKTDSIIILAHGFCSSKDRERLIQISNIYVENGLSTLRFDFGGCGDSYETEITVSGEVDDLKSAIEFVKDKGYKNIGIQGESLGGLVSILAYNKEIKTMVLWAPVTKGKDKLKEILAEERLSEKEFEEIDYIIKKKHGRDYKIPRKYFEERLKINQKEILSKIKNPILIIHGDKDDSVPLEGSKEAIKYLPKGSRLEVVKGAGHILDENYNTFDLSLNWFSKVL